MEERLCPILCAGLKQNAVLADARCMRNDCAWFYREDEMCSILRIATQRDFVPVDTSDIKGY